VSTQGPNNWNPYPTSACPAILTVNSVSIAPSSQFCVAANTHSFRKARPHAEGLWNGLVENFPQAFSHIALVNAAFDLEDSAGTRDRVAGTGVEGVVRNG